VIGFWDFIARRCPAAAELDRSAMEVKGVGVVWRVLLVVASGRVSVSGWKVD
jgi:hypothetical protein